MKKEKLFQALSLLFDACVGDYGAFATHESEPTATHDSQSKGDPKVAAAHSSKAGGRTFRKGKFWQARQDFSSSVGAGRSHCKSARRAGLGGLHGARFCLYRLRDQCVVIFCQKQSKRTRLRSILVMAGWWCRSGVRPMFSYSVQTLFCSLKSVLY